VIREGDYIMPMSSKEMIRYLKKHGFVEMKHAPTGHCKLHNPVTKKTTVVPCHGKDLGKGLEQAILKEAGLK